MSDISERCKDPPFTIVFTMGDRELGTKEYLRKNPPISGETVRLGHNGQYTSYVITSVTKDATRLLAQVRYTPDGQSSKPRFNFWD